MGLAPPRRLRATTILLAGFAATALTGCFADPTEVVVVVDTDAKPGTDFAQIELTVTSGATQGFTQTQQAFSFNEQLPVTLGVKRGGPSETFDVLVTLNTTTSVFQPAMTSLPAFATRKAANVAFVKDQLSVLFIPVFRACACVDASGMPITSCPNALQPQCHDLVAPKLGEFDDGNVPHLTAAQTAAATP
jgi:hypothetical protein